MKQTLASLHPNPGWTSVQSEVNVPAAAAAGDRAMETPSAIGKHCILELYGCDPARLDDEAFLRSLITTAVQQAGATLLNLITHHFAPQGVTGLALLAESHLSIHTWPESGYAAVDVFTCGDHTMPERACEILRLELVATGQNLRSFRRETPPELDQQQRTPD